MMRYTKDNLLKDCHLCVIEIYLYYENGLFMVK